MSAVCSESIHVSSYTQTQIEPVVWEIDGYVREISNELYPKIIPPEINYIIYMLYDPVCNEQKQPHFI